MPHGNISTSADDLRPSPARPRSQIPRPDGRPEEIGLTVLDEPSARHQSDPSLLSLKLRQTLKLGSARGAADPQQSQLQPAAAQQQQQLSGPGAAPVVRVARDAQDVQSWIRSIGALHESQAYNSSNLLQLISANATMPEVERLMQELPAPVEQLINSNEVLLPDKDLDCDLDEFVSIICGQLRSPRQVAPNHSVNQI